ncbi:glycoside hydrolase family 88 protein [Croceibacterium sp. TMG7-5b_MA50]|uniref:glycoside hydrolase family 88/105 protein n=1 Tax=Croceibacterium sp. TMG7-5b_MA50 TaxID=3121290 RepID=UPI003221E3FE
MAPLPLVPAVAQAQLRPVDITLPPRPDLSFATDIVPDPARVLAVMEYAALAEIADLERKPFQVLGRSVDEITANWVSATFYTGLTRVARVSDRPEPMRFLVSVADHFNFAMRGTRSPKGLLNADDQAIGELYQELYVLRREDGYIMPTQQRLDFSLPHLRAEPQPARLVWWWCDALFMAPPVLSRMSAITGDRRYLDAMDVQWWRTSQALYDPAEGLFFRDPRFVTHRSDSGGKVFWSRGNGWVLAGLARVLDHMPADYPTRDRYLDQFRQMAARIAGLQQSDGLWRADLLDVSAFPEPETSGSALHTYALAWGVNHGVLPRDEYLPQVLRGWAGLNRHILPNGQLGAVQKTGDQPVPTAADDVGMYGTGAFLLAAAEIMQLAQPVQALPVPPPALPAPPAAERPATPARPGTAPSGEAARRAREMQATRDLAYDPRVDAPDLERWTPGPPIDEWTIAPRRQP